MQSSAPKKLCSVRYMNDKTIPKDGLKMSHRSWRCVMLCDVLFLQNVFLCCYCSCYTVLSIFMRYIFGDMKNNRYLCNMIAKNLYMNIGLPTCKALVISKLYPLIFV